MMFTRRLNKELYGPSRTSANEEIKDVLLGDHVLQKGEWYENGQRNPWATSFAISFKVGPFDEVFKVNEMWMAKMT